LLAAYGRDSVFCERPDWVVEQLLAFFGEEPV
jgi:hypothetical protein